MPLYLPRPLLTAALCAISPLTVNAALTDNIWQGTTDNWATGTNWSEGSRPSADTVRAVINNSLTPAINSVAFNTNAAIGGLEIASGFTLTRATGDTGSRVLTLNASTATDSYFNNAGSIITGGTSGSLTISIINSAGTVQNSGLIEASAGTQLIIQSGHVNIPITLTNTDGTIQTAGSGVLNLGSSTGNSPVYITGGSLKNVAGTINQGRVSEFTDVAITNGGIYNVINTETNTRWTLQLNGTSTLNNSGTMNIERIFAGTESSSAQQTSINISSANASITNSGTINFITEGSPIAGGASNSFNFNESSEVTNNGTINLISKSTTNLVQMLIATDKTATFSGTGELVMSVGVGGSVDQIQVTGGNNAILVNSAGHTIRGAGRLGNNRVDDINNAGTIHADSSSTLTLDIDSATTGTIINSGTLRSSGTGGFVIVDGTITNTGTVRVDSGSTLTIQGGTFTSTAGTIQADGILANTPDLLVSGGIITGQGSISGNVNIDGPVSFTAGGASTHVLTFDGNLVFNAAGSSRTISFNFDHFDSRIDVGGALTQGLNNLFEFNFDNGAAYEIDTVYTLISVTGSNSLNDATFSISSSSLSAGYVLDTTFGGGDGWLVSGGNLQVRFSSVTTGVIPEPSQTLLSVIAGVAGIMFYSRRRKVAA